MLVGGGVVRLLRPPCVALAVVPSRGRKSRHDPPAKSKASRLPLPPAICPEELLNIRRRYLDYGAMLAALRSEFRRELIESRNLQQTGLLAERRALEEGAEHQALMAWNLEENRKALASRLERLRLEEAAMRLQKEESNRLQEEARLQSVLEREEEVELLQAESRNFITPENILERIEAALDNPKSYNFCLDREGRILQPRP